MLYIVATPIGNLDDVTLRAIDVLKSVDVIAAEDTRHTALLLNKYDIKTRMIAYHKFNERKSVDGLIDMLKGGSDVAVVSDAGMPTVSDPGHVVIDEAIKNNIEFTVVSGACAAINAVVLSGLDTRAFTVLGFLPEKNIDRKRFVEPYKNIPSTLVFYSSVHNIKSDLEFFYESFGARAFAVCREMTKMFETVTRGTLGESVEIVEKGEFVVVISGAKELSSELNELSIEEHLKRYLDDGDDEKTAVKKVAFDRKVQKNEVYQVMVELKKR